MSPVDAQVGEEDEERELRVVVPAAGALLRGIVELAVAAHLGDEGERGADCHDGHGHVGLFHLETDLVLEKFWVAERLLVKDEDVRQSREDKVVEDAEEPGTFAVLVSSVRNTVRVEEL